MTEREDPCPVPYGLVEHVHRTKSGKTVMAITLSVELRARMAQAALDLGCSKLALVRTALSQFLVAHEEARRSGQKRALAAVSEVSPPVPDREPVKLELEPEEPVPSPVSLPEPSPEPVKAPRRARKEKP